MTNERDEIYAERMQKWVDCGDTEVAHIEADDLLCELLTALGYEKTVAAYCEVGKWYA